MAGSTKDEPLSKEEQEEEEMRHELSNAGLLEENMDINEMRDLMKAVNASKIEMNESKIDINVQKSPGPSFTASKPQSSPDTAKTVLHRPLPSFSYRNAVLTSDTTVAGPAYDLLKKGNTPESVYDNPFETSINQTDGPSNKSIHEKSSTLSSDDQVNCRYGSKNNIDGQRQLRPRAKKQTPAMLKKMNLERFKMNEFVFGENFKITKELEQANLKINPNCFDDVYLDSEKFQDSLEHMCREMEKLHDQFIEAEVSKITETQKSQWGSPIKMATKSGWNGSMDKNPFPEMPEESTTNRAGTSSRGTHDRATKRKALTTIAAVARNDSSQNCIDDDDTDDECIDTKKRKFQQAKKAEEVAKKSKEAQKSKVGSDDKDLEMIEIDGNVLKEKQPSDLEVYDNSDLHSLRRSSHNDILQNSKIIDDIPQYPIRVEPPNPSKKCYKGPRAKNKKISHLETNNVIKKKMEVSDEEITKVINNINKEMGENDSECIDITDEIKPAPISKTQNKLQMAQANLKKIQEEEEKQKIKHEESKKKVEKETAQRNNEKVKKTLKEMEEKHKLEEEKKTKLQEQEKFYKSFLNSRQQGMVTRANFKKVIKSNYDEIDEDVLLAGDDDEPMITNVVTKNQCPICQKSFPADEIEEHASGCNAFDDQISLHQPSTSYESRLSCNICKNFTTDSGASFEEHIVICTQQADDKRTGIYA